MTDTYLLRLTGVQRDFLLELLRGRAEDTAHFLYGHLLNAEEWDPRRKIEATTVTGLSREEFTDLLRPVEPTLATRDDVLERAGALIGGTRAETYGSARESFTRIGMLWGDILGQPVLATDVARLMIAMKLSRLHEHDDHADSWVDIAGYAALGAEIAGVEL